MVTPTKDEILAKATEMWFQWQVRQGFTPETLPEEGELKEDICPWTGLSWWETARRELMKSPESIALDEQIRFLEEQYGEAVEKIKERVWDEAEKLIKEAERRAEEAEKAREEEAEKSRRQIEELKAKLGRTPKPFRVVKPFVWGVKWEPGQTLRTVDWEWAFKMVESGYLEPIPEEAAPPAAPKPPEVKPPPAPPPKVLPEIPELCPLDGTPISEVTRVPIGPVPVRLSAEEEYLRARLGLPIPERELVWLEVPPTMKVYSCERDHLFERDPRTGRLVERTPEYVYRKIIRETAALRRVAYPGVPPALPPTLPYRIPPPFVGPASTQDLWWSWLENVKGINRWDFLKLSEEEQKKLRDEWVRYRMGGG